MRGLSEDNDLPGLEVTAPPLTGEPLRSDVPWREHVAELGRFLMARGIHASQIEDLVQEVLTRAWASRGKITGFALRGYLFGVARNVIREEFARSKKKRRFLIDVPLDLIPSSDASHEQQVALHDEIEHVRQVMERLPDKLRRALVLTILHRHSGPEAACLEGCSADAFRRRLADARKMMVRLLSNVPQSAIKSTLAARSRAGALATNKEPPAPEEL
jgi:RNA polymerase sigma factor (sigma-70 family)